MAGLLERTRKAHAGASKLSLVVVGHLGAADHPREL
jgi:hypothetical protein